MMSFESLFGLPALDACVKASSKNHLVFIVGSSGSGKSMLVKNSIAVHLESGRGAVVVLLDEDIESFLDSLSQYISSKDVLKSLDEGRLRVVDVFSSRLSRFKSLMRSFKWDVKYADPSDPSSIIDGIRIVLEDLRSRNVETVIVIDSLNEIITSSDPIRAAEFIKTVKAVFTRVFKQLVLTTIHLDSDTVNNWFKEYAYVADGIILMDVTADQKGRIYRYFQVKRFRSSDHCVEPVVYKVESGRIIAQSK